MEEELNALLSDPSVGHLVAAVIGVALVYGVAKVLQRSLTRPFKDADMRYRVRKLITFLSYAAAVFVVANVYSDRLSGLTVAFGVAGAGIAFALQEVIASVAGWIAVSFGQFYKPGERVQLGGIKGDVIDIGVLRTTIMQIGDWVNGDLYNGRIVRVANSFVFKEPVVNYSADFPFLWDEITFPVHYGSDWRLARSILEGCAKEVIGDYPAQSRAAWKNMVQKYLIEDATVDPVVTMRADQSSIEFTVRYIVDYRKRRTTKDRLFTRILEEIEKTDKKVQVAYAGLEITAFPPVIVKQPEV